MKTQYSQILNQNITITDTGIIIAEDGNEYSRAEQMEIKNCSDDTKQELHMIKNAVKGVIHKPFRDDLKYFTFEIRVGRS